MQGPKDTTELRELLRPREYPSDPPGEKPRVHLVQGPSDALRDRLFEAGKVLYALVPDAEYQEMVGNVLYDLALIGEATLCRNHGVDTEHDALRELRAHALAERTYAKEAEPPHPPPSGPPDGSGPSQPETPPETAPKPKRQRKPKN